MLLSLLLLVLAIALPVAYLRYSTVLQTLQNVLLCRGQAIPSKYALEELKFCL